MSSNCFNYIEMLLKMTQGVIFESEILYIGEQSENGVTL